MCDFFHYFHAFRFDCNGENIFTILCRASLEIKVADRIQHGGIVLIHRADRHFDWLVTHILIHSHFLEILGVIVISHRIFVSTPDELVRGCCTERHKVVKATAGFVCCIIFFVTYNTYGGKCIG